MTRKFASQGLRTGSILCALLIGVVQVECGTVASSSNLTYPDFGPGGPTDGGTDGSMDGAVVLRDAEAGDSGGVAPILGSAESFAVLGGQTVTNTGATTVTGNLGVSPGTALTGFPPGMVLAGTIHVADPIADTAERDLTTAYDSLKGAACSFVLAAQDLGGLTLTPGVYCFSSPSSLAVTLPLTLDARGNPNAIFIFQIGSTLTVADNASVRVINGGRDCSVYWQVSSSATIGKGAAFAGNIVAFASVTLMTGARVSGRALARNGAVTLDSNDVSFASCTAVLPTPDMAAPVADAQMLSPPDLTSERADGTGAIGGDKGMLSGGGFSCSTTHAGNSAQGLLFSAALLLGTLLSRLRARRHRERVASMAA